MEVGWEARREGRILKSLGDSDVSSTETSPIYSNLSDDADMADLIAEFVQCLQERAAALDAAVQGENLQDLLRLAHQLRGASGGYGFDDIGIIAGKLEDATRVAQSVNEVRHEVDALVNMCRRAHAGVPTT